MTIAAPGSLAGLRVLDFTQALAGPFCTQILADHGAEVIKIEAPGVGDITRNTGPFHRDDKDRVYSGYFTSVNRNKKSLALDLKSDEGRKLLLAMLPEFDVVVENFRAGVMDRLGLSYEVLRDINPRLVYATVRGFGDPRTGDSPYKNWPAYDVVAQAMGGISGVTGPGPGQPTKIGPGVGDTVPALYLTIGILAAVLKARADGKGQFVDVSMVDAVLAVSERIVYQMYFGDVVARPEGNHQPMLSPFGFFPVRDGHVAIAATTDHFFRTLCAALGAEELAENPAYATMTLRMQNRLPLIDDLAKVTVNFTKTEMNALLGGQVPFGPVYDMADIAADAHFAARDMLVPVELEGIDDPIRIAGVPVKLSETPGGVYRRGPLLGEHTDEILARAGYDSDNINRWRAAGIVA